MKEQISNTSFVLFMKSQHFPMRSHTVMHHSRSFVMEKTGFADKLTDLALNKWGYLCKIHECYHVISILLGSMLWTHIIQCLCHHCSFAEVWLTNVYLYREGFGFFCNNPLFYAISLSEAKQNKGGCKVLKEYLFHSCRKHQWHHRFQKRCVSRKALQVSQDLPLAPKGEAAPNLFKSIERLPLSLDQAVNK